MVGVFAENMAEQKRQSSAIQGWCSSWNIPTWLIRFGMNCWFPFVGSAIHITTMSKDMRHVVVRMKLRWYNRNFVGTHFGGALFAMTDPFYMMMILTNLGSQYIVWDKHSSIVYRQPGRGTVWAQFTLSAEQIALCKEAADTHGKYEQEFSVNIVDKHGTVIATVSKMIYIRRKSSQKADQ